MTKLSKFDITVIIPIYNQEQHIENCIRSLQNQTMQFSRMEIILVNDGSTDDSKKICEYFEGCYENIVYIEQKNAGVSAARNAGINAAIGKYIFFLDADDELSSETLQKVTDFFETVYDEVDLVTYPIETVYQGKVLAPHFRYQFLKETGVYDLRDHAYIGQTTMNIVVKNQFWGNVLFDEAQTFSEDQKYCCDILKKKLRMGFCKDGKYIYYRDPGSASGRLAGSCYIFEQCMRFFEELFAGYPGEVPLTFQGLYVNDVYWKLVSNILLPYHYGREDYQKALDRIDCLLQRCRSDVILNHPQMDFFEKFYLLRRCGRKRLRWSVDSGAYYLYHRDIPVLKETSMEMVITRVRVKGHEVELSGFLKTVFFQFYEKAPTLFVTENGGSVKRKIQLYPSSHNYYLSHENTQRFWAMKYRCDVSNVQDIRFEVELEKNFFPVHYYFMPLVPFSHDRKRYCYKNGNVKMTIDGKNDFHFTEIANAEQKKIWLYYDCSGVPCDNGLLQFEHDMKKEDGISRYYIVSDERQKKFLSDVEHTVLFGSRKHQKLFLQAEKIVTAYIEDNNIIPFEKEKYDLYAGKFQFEIIYLQHGVLHIDMPWKYSREKILADRIVVSTEEEAELYKKNGYREEDLIKTGMPRLEKLKKKKSAKKILFAPSWRGYLVGAYINRQWQPLDEKFKKSRYYQEINAFLSSEELHAFLVETGFELEVKMHPIFRMYEKYFHWDSDRISFAQSDLEDGEFDLFITDFSSYAFNFMYLSIPVLHFIPDVDEFKCGMNGYRKLNYPDTFWNHVATEYLEIIREMKNVIVLGIHEEQDVHFFKCDNIRENIYKEMYAIPEEYSV